ncbi:MAG: PAS domain S-box protein, partial [Victivallales bacterium]|nr:PAS domain S-box protein [Victivallales bacterium]
MNTMQAKEDTAGRRRWWAPLLTAILVTGTLFTWWLANRADHEMRRDMLQQAHLVAQAVNGEHVKALSGTEADLEKREYGRLKEQFASVRQANDECRFLYLMGRKDDGAVFFYVDSEPADSEDCSPAGQMYEEASEGVRRVFDTATALVEGPVPDRWGTWVTALVPLADPATGELIAVLGMDVDARTWKSSVAARAALPVGLMLLLIGIVAALFISGRTPASPKPVLRRLLLPLVALLVLTLASAGTLLWRQYGAHRSERSSRAGKEVAQDLGRDLEMQAEGLAVSVQIIAADPRVSQALRGSDRDRLLADWRGLFETLHQEQGLTHFYFFDANRVCLLRVHKPEKRGDRIERFTAAEAEGTGKTASGIELGPLGTFTLRVVQPVFDGQTLLGYVELGKEIEDALQSIQQRSGGHVAVAIGKEAIDRETWETGMRMLGREADWERFPHSVIIYASQGRLPDAFAPLADHDPVGDQEQGAGQVIVSDGRHWHVLSSPLQDASGKDVGTLLYMSDRTTQDAAEMRTVALGGTAGAVLLAALFALVFVMLRRTDAGIQAQQAALKASESLQRSITDAAQDAILMMDPEGLISFCNPAGERILGYAMEEAIGQNLHDLIVPPRYHDAHAAAFPAFQETGAGNAVGKTLDLIARRKDGEEIAVNLSLSAVHMTDGWHAVGLLRDITERKQAEEELREMNTALKKQTLLATEMASQAEMANAAKSEFLANMSHEIRTPMNGVIGMTGLLLDTELTDEQQRYAEIVRTSGESLLGLINDILDFSKIEAGKLELEVLDFDLGSLLDDFASALALRANDKGLELLCAADQDVPTLVRGDPGRLRQILNNLVGNAIKFTADGEVAVRVTVESQDDEGALLRFAVRDTGIGIPADKIGLLFNKFTQADASTTRQYGGTGLGLAISKELAEMMGGQTGVTSEDGKGSEFWFTVRLGKQPDAVPREPSLQADLRNVRGLIVDDNATNREIVRMRLGDWGMRPSEAEDGPSALQALHRAVEENDPFRLAVIDMQMPGMDGASLGRAIQADPRLAPTRMVMLTSLGVRGDAKLYEDIGFAGYLTKPVRHQELRGVISLALSGSGETMPPARPITTRHTAREALPKLGGRKARILLAEDNITNQQVALGILKKLGLHADAVANGRE